MLARAVALGILAMRRIASDDADGRRRATLIEAAGAFAESEGAVITPKGQDPLRLACARAHRK